MKKSFLIVVLIAVIGALVLWTLLYDDQDTWGERPHTDIAGSQQVRSGQERLQDSLIPERQRLAIVTEGFNNSELTERVLSEVSIRLGDRQFEEALNELAGLAAGFDELSDIEKSIVLQSYARYFLSISQIEDAYFFYESILELPNLGFDNRMAFLQLASRIAVREQDWTRFLDFNDQYFAEGGEYNYVVADNLVRAYKGLEDYNAAAEALLQYMDTGINPVTIETEERYERWVGINENLPLQVTDPVLSLELARRLTQHYDRKQNWRTLAAIYQEQGDETNYNRVMSVARDRGFLDRRGNWIE